MTRMNRFVTQIRRAQPRASVFAMLLAAASASLAHAAPDGTAPAPRPLVDTSTCSRPVYPEEDARLQNTGTVTMHFLIGPDGWVVDSTIQRSSGYPSLDEAARTALLKCRFRPATLEGKPVRAWTAVQYVWTPE